MSWYTSPVVVDICTSAMVKLGAEPIQDLLDNTKEARLCKLQYPKIRDAVLRSAPWSFALKRVQLSPVVQALPFGDQTVFQLPIDCVRFVRMQDRYLRYSIEGDKLLANTDIVNGWYVTNIVAEDQYDANFREAVASMLAADLCYSIVQSTTMKQLLEATAKMMIDEARSYNSQEVTPEDFHFDEFLNSRRGSREIYDDPTFI